jgi:hypothetical protein
MHIDRMHIDRLSSCIRRTWLAALVGTAQFGSPAVQASEPSLLTDSWYVSLGTFNVGSETKVRLDGEAGTGDRVDLERTFGDDEAHRFRLDAWWRFAERHKIRALWFDSSASSARTIDTEIDWGDETFPVGAEVRVDRDFSIYELAYEYSFLRRPSYEFTASIGLHYTQFDVGLSAELAVDGQPTETRTAADSAQVDAPLPAIGFRGLWNPGGNFWIDASAQYFALSISEYDGRLTDYRVAAVWQPKRWLGLGFGYNAFAIDMDVDKPDFKGSMDWGYSGPQLFLSGSF